MKFWIFMFVINLLIPLTMIFFGYRYIGGARQEINALSGYRTVRSMKSAATWDFAHRYFGRLWCRIGWIVCLPLALATMLLLLGRSESAITYVSCGLCALQLILMILPAIFTEYALARRFDAHGHPIKK